MRLGVTVMGVLGLLGLLGGFCARRNEASPRAIPGVARLALPADFEGGGPVHEEPAAAIFHFATKRLTDWGGYSHYRSILLLTVFAPDATAADIARGRAETRRRLLLNLEKVAWTPPAEAGGASLHVGEGTYTRNYVEPTWIVRREDHARRFDLDLVTWKKAHSREAAVRLVEDCARSFGADPRLAERFAEIRDRPRREAEEQERRVALLREHLARRGFPPLVAGEARRHAEFLYELRGVGLPFFTIGRALGSLGPWTTPRRPFDLEFLKPPPPAGGAWPPLFTRERTGEEWNWGLGPAHLLPDRLVDMVAREAADPRVIYFFTFTTVSPTSQEPDEVARELDHFLAAAPKMAEAFRAGELVRPRPFR